MGKANRVKGQVRTNHRFQCESGHPATGQTILYGPIRFKHEDARKDWEHHNLSAHDGKNTTMMKEEAIKILLSQKIMVG